MPAWQACYGFGQWPEGPAERAIEGVQRRDNGDDRDNFDIALLAEPAIRQVPDPLLSDAPGVGCQAVDRFHGLCRQLVDTVMTPVNRIGRRASLRRWQSAHDCARRASTAMAIRSAPVHQLPEVASVSQATSNALINSGRTGNSAVPTSIII